MYTCTGRISMHEPNLQNVPRTFCIPLKYLTTNDFEPSDDVVEFNCRNIFKAAPGYVFVSADYCQLEMRILTHYSKDAVLSKIMSANVDVFKSIAAALAGISEDNVSFTIEIFIQVKNISLMLYIYYLSFRLLYCIVTQSAFQKPPLCILS